MVGPVIKGIQSNGVIATAKHYILNKYARPPSHTPLGAEVALLLHACSHSCVTSYRSQEDHRGNMSSNVDERTLMQIYLPPFAAAVNAGVGAIMCGYNKVNNQWACENEVTLRLLKEQLNFSGWVMSDWGATHSLAASVSAGLLVRAYRQRSALWQAHSRADQGVRPAAAPAHVPVRQAVAAGQC